MKKASQATATRYDAELPELFLRNSRDIINVMQTFRFNFIPIYRFLFKSNFTTKEVELKKRRFYGILFEACLQVLC
ncbi:CLUMA_CG003788, isoform A [Clunio marinus]|uniref:CLUMA_CG003788, isoform A n=1 Tax=Clunio marinus TaxID=568069 RepID=A0A1J1HPV6_9DIPT|nr:CLUMA_CG003788, isoform A [Clunio marinus]